MSTEGDHVALANRFQSTLELMLVDIATCSELISVCAFYKSLHVIEAIFHRDPTIRHAKNHKERLQFVGKSRRYSTLYPSYNALWSASTVARYLQDHSKKSTYIQFSDFIPPDDLRPLLLDRYLFPFESIATQLLGDPDSLKRYQSSSHEK